MHALDPINLTNRIRCINSNGYLDINEKWIYREDHSLIAADLDERQIMNWVLAETKEPRAVLVLCLRFFN
ncbi:hypothetical protein BOW55_20195 [Flavobacterium sp. YO12]|nr:hypothetical protein BOW55_20195 [Flavobacterium sp. YO12]